MEVGPAEVGVPNFGADAEAAAPAAPAAEAAPGADAEAAAPAAPAAALEGAAESSSSDSDDSVEGEQPDWLTPEDEGARSEVYLVTFAAVLAATAEQSDIPLRVLDAVTREMIRDAVLDAVANPVREQPLGGREQRVVRERAASGCMKRAASLCV